MAGRRTISSIRDVAIDEIESNESMAQGRALRALALLARWAARRAWKQANIGGGGHGDLVTYGVIKRYKLAVGQN